MVRYIYGLFLFYPFAALRADTLRVMQVKPADNNWFIDLTVCSYNYNAVSCLKELLVASKSQF